MTIVVVGASGATGTQLVEQLIALGHNVKAVVRSPEKLPSSWKELDKLSIISASLLDLTDQEMIELTRDCDAVASCLGHNLSFKGIYGHPRKLVTDAVKRLSKAIEVHKPKKPIKFVLMNTTGNQNRDLKEPVSLGQKVVIGLLRLLLPPHVDNENAADYLRAKVGQKDQFIQWAVIRPDSLIDNKEVTEYVIHPSPIRNPIFNPGKSSRINVANLMARLIDDEKLWNTWKGQMPVIYNRSSLTETENLISEINEVLNVSDQ